MSVLVLQHEAVEGPGRIAVELRLHRHDFEIIRLDLDPQVPPFDSERTGLVVLGGSMGLADIEQLPHLRKERELILQYLNAEIPVLGICLGAQLMASALGATVRPGNHWELGWHPVELTDAASQDPLFQGLPKSMSVLHWHRDQFELPTGATKLARSSATPVQAFSWGPSGYGLLFHLETERAQVARMASTFPEDVAAAGSSVSDLTDSPMQSETTSYAHHIFSRWIQLIENSQPAPSNVEG